MPRVVGSLDVQEAAPSTNPGAGYGRLYTDPTAPGRIFERTSAGVLVPLGFGNPMTTAGDVIVGGASGSPGRLALGTAGHTLKAGATAPVYEPHARKNLLLNGSTRVCQMTPAVDSAAITVDMAYQVADGWKTLQNTGTTWGIYHHSASPISGRSILLLSSGNSAKAGVMQILENRDTAHLRSQLVSLQAQIFATVGLTDVRWALLSWAGAADAPTDPVSAWNAGNTNPTLAASWAYVNTPAALPVVGGFWSIQKLQAQTVPAGCNNLAAMIWCEDLVTTVNVDFFAISDVQLEVGSICTAFERVPFREELADCKRWYQKSAPYASNPGAASTAIFVQPSATPTDVGARIRMGYPLPVEMRTTPTPLYWDNAGTPGVISTISNDTIVNGVAAGTPPLGGTSATHLSFVSANGPMIVSYSLDARL